uniref:Uncharacterized protein n=1 Tax=viral metagenome TaxID=1070528 RepID=A0A6C0BJ75_9ZZZZ
MNYPDEIIVEKGSSEYEVLHKHSEVFRMLAKYSENKDKVKLSSEFFDDEWPMFVDLFFPEMGINPLFKFKNNSIQLRSNRGTDEQLAQLFRFLLINEDASKKIAESQALKQINAPPEIVPRGTGTRRRNIERKFNNKNYNNYNNNNHNKNFKNDNNYNGPKLGFTSKEKKYLSKLSEKNAKIYFPNERRRKTRRIKV